MSYPSAEMQSAYFTAPADWVILFSVISSTLVVSALSLCRDAIGVFYSSSRLGKKKNEEEEEIDRWPLLLHQFFSVRVCNAKSETNEAEKKQKLRAERLIK